MQLFIVAGFTERLRGFGLWSLLGAVMLDAGERRLSEAMIREIEVGMKDAGEPSSYKSPSNPAQSQPSDFERDPSLLGLESGTFQFVDMNGLVTKLGATSEKCRIVQNGQVVHLQHVLAI